MSCNIFTDQTKETVAFYKGAARELGAPTTGTTSNFSIDYNHAGRFVTFYPDGTIARDPQLDVPWDFFNNLRMAYIRDHVRHRQDNVLTFEKR